MNREDLIKCIDDHLSGIFVKDGEKWTLEKEQPGQRQTIIINGQQSVQQGPPNKVNFLIEVVGDGSMKDEKKEEPFVQIHFEVKVNNHVNADFEETFYYDDIELLSNIINQML